MQKIEDFVNTLDASGIDGGLRGDVPNSVALAAINAMSIAIVNKHPVLRGVINDLNEQALTLAYIEVARQQYGDELVDAAIADAKTQPTTVYHCIMRRANQVSLEAAISNINEKLLLLAEAMRTAIADYASGIPANRHTKRASKHRKPMQDGDQEWKKRNRR